MKLAFTIALLLASAATGLSRIGENEKEIEAAYGQPGKDLGNRGNVHQVGYMAGGYMILVSYVNGVSQRESFGKPDGSALNTDELQKILTFNTPEGMKWEETPAESGDKAWKRSDNKAIAIYPASGKFFSIQDVSFVQPKE